MGVRLVTNIIFFFFLGIDSTVVALSCSPKKNSCLSRYNDISNQLSIWYQGLSSYPEHDQTSFIIPCSPFPGKFPTRSLLLFFSSHRPGSSLKKFITISRHPPCCCTLGTRRNPLRREYIFRVSSLEGGVGGFLSCGSVEINASAGVLFLPGAKLPHIQYSKEKKGVVLSIRY